MEFFACTAMTDNVIIDITMIQRWKYNGNTRIILFHLMVGTLVGTFLGYYGYQMYFICEFLVAE